MIERIGIVYPWSHFDTVPSLCNAAELLAGRGYKVEIYTYSDSLFLAPSFANQGIEVISSRIRGERRVLDRFLPLDRLLPFLIQRRHYRNRYRCFIGVDPQGLLQASKLTRFIRTPLVYYSLELFLSGELKDPAQKRLKQHEIELSRKAALIITQDHERAKLLAKDNGLPLDRIALVPNAPVGPARRNPSSYWHERFGLLRDVRIVLHAGSVGVWTGIEEIVDSVRTWPEKWVLVVHTRVDTQSSADVERLQKSAAPGRVFFSRRPVSRHEYDALVDGADVGIAFYVPTPTWTETQRNLEAVGLSSGKTGYYLRSGLPVIVNQTSYLSDLVRRKDCGVAVQTHGDIAAAIVRIDTHYQRYSAQACEAFDTDFDFGPRFQEISTRISSLPTTNGW